MTILKHLIAKADDTLDEIEEYSEKAMLLKSDHKSIADTYIKIAEIHINIYDMLHKEMVSVIEEHKRMGHQPPPEMMAIWEYEHEKLVKEFKDAKILVEEYKKSY